MTKVNCGSCRACCQGHQMIALQPGEDTSRYMIKTQINPLTGGTIYALLHKPNGDCMYLGEAGCTIYAGRPLICRAYNCVQQALDMERDARGLRGAEKRRVRRWLDASPMHQAGLARAERK